MDVISLLKRSRTSWAWPIAAVGYEVLVRVQLVFEGLLDAMFSSPQCSPAIENVTAVIKTFERPRKLQRLVKSIKRHYPTLKIIVVDDSETPVELKGIQTIVMPYDSGVSAGRNEGLRHVTTPYVLILDDDFIFNRHTDVVSACGNMEAYLNIDILAGKVIYLPLRTSADYQNANLFPSNLQPNYPPGTSIGGFPVRDKVPNFYVGRTVKIREVGWDNELKRIDHADFFTRAIGVLTSVQDENFKVLHYPTYFGKKYMAKKRSVELDRARLQQKYYDGVQG